ncbi:MAG: family 10 glycosylhydrolase [Candidatus Omnitrophica bacterium]|nr:family 10 glycosylhydrolase [Candidatus Omnitrophota bacterium]MDD5770794.1 family 10 glycosylhydrolase [Candidatus Omnitrophota bacterium]
MKKRILILLFLFLSAGMPFCARAQEEPARGVWISVFSARDVLYSKEDVDKLITRCKKAKINEIYLQFFQSGNAYYDSKVCDKKKYDEMVKAAGMDTLDLLLREAQENKIKVFAWVNVLSLGRNDQADILKKYGNSILTLDQYKRTSRIESKTELDKYYLRENQIFLEPGDPRITEYMLTVINEIVNRYPLISGVHLDYIRYPSPVPFIPGSRFKKFGLTYGYGPENLRRFTEKTGINPLQTLNNEDEYLAWDNWKRQQVTELVRKISSLVKLKSADLEISCAVIPLTERAYANAFQDWSDWLEEGIVDYVVLMSYTKDNQFIKEVIKSALGNRGKGRIYAGIGLFLMKNIPDLFFNQYRIVTDLSVDGIVFFSIDDLDDGIVDFLGSKPYVKS